MPYHFPRACGWKNHGLEYPEGYFAFADALARRLKVAHERPNQRLGSAVMRFALAVLAGSAAAKLRKGQVVPRSHRLRRRRLFGLPPPHFLFNFVQHLFRRHLLFQFLKLLPHFDFDAELLGDG